MHKFVPERKVSLKGFWVAEEGAEIRGVLDEYVPGQPRPFYVLRLDSAQDVQVKTREGELLHCAGEGDRVGVSSFVELLGLNKFLHHFVSIRCTGVRVARSGRDMRTFDVDVSDEPVERRGADERHDHDDSDNVPF